MSKPARKYKIYKTNEPCIKCKEYEDGEKVYLVTLDYGRQLREDKKTGETKLKQVKSTKTVSTLKEARALLGQNRSEKARKTKTGTTRRLYFRDVIRDYDEAYANTWSDSYKMQKQAQERRIETFFNNQDVRSVSTLDIEAFFEWCRTPHPPAFPYALSNNSIQKIKTHMNGLYKFMKKGGVKYNIRENVVLDAEVGKIEKFQATTLSSEQLNEMLRYALDNELDYSIFAMIGLTGLAGLRRGELCGVQWGDLDYDNGLIDVARQRCQISTGSIVKVPKGGDDNGKTREERKQRYACFPHCLQTLLEYVKEQQEQYLHRPVEPDDYIYMTKINLVNGYLPHPGKISRRFTEFQERMAKARAKAGEKPIPIIRLHDMRHTFISLCINGGVSQYQVSFNCGHSFNKQGNNVTVSTYLHDDNNRKEINAFIDKTISTSLEIPDMKVSKD